MLRELDTIETKTPHQWRESYGYDPATYCSLCHASNYDTQTKFCEDWYEEKEVRLQKKEHRHPPTEAAWDHARLLLTFEEWNLMELQTKRPYRVKDYIHV
jgi:hypothetical protein